MQPLFVIARLAAALLRVPFRSCDPPRIGSMHPVDVQLPIILAQVLVISVDLMTRMIQLRQAVIRRSGPFFNCFKVGLISAIL